MEALILAGGFGTRLKPLTYTRAKPMLPVMNRPMISYLVKQLPDVVDKVVIAANYRNGDLEDFFNRNDFGKEIIINDEPKPLGTGGAVKFAEKNITGRFFVLNADIISSLNMDKMIGFHEKNGGFVTISLWPVKDVSAFGVVDLTGDKITKFVEKPKPEEAPSNLINAGAYLLEPEILDYIERGRMVSMEKEIFPRIIEDGRNSLGFKITGYWIDVGRISSYLEVHKLLMEKTGKDNVTGDGCEILGNLSKTCLGNNVYVGKGCEIEGSVIYDDVKIMEGVVMKNSVVGGKCVVGSNSILENVVIGDGENIKEGSKIGNGTMWTQKVPEGYPEKQIGNVLR